MMLPFQSEKPARCDPLDIACAAVGAVIKINMLHITAFIDILFQPNWTTTAISIKQVPKVTHFVDACSRLYTSGNLIRPMQPAKSKNIPIRIKIIVMLFIKSPPFKIFCQCCCPNER